MTNQPNPNSQGVSDWKLRLRNELRMSAMKTTFTFTRDEVIDLMGETAISIMSARELQQAQEVSDADLGAALREFRQHFPLQASAAWHYATERAKDMNVARELQQCPNCLNDGCHCATCNPYPGQLQQAQVVGEVHPDDLAVDRFAAAMKEKLAAARAKGRGGWDTEDATADGLSALLRHHVDKGDPRDVANFCMFLHQRGEAITTPQSSATQQAQEVGEVDGCTESNCQRCMTAPYARGDMKHAGIGSYPNATPQSSAPVVGDEMVAKAYRVCEDFIEEHGDGYINDLDDGQWNEMLRAALESALTGRG